MKARPHPDLSPRGEGERFAAFGLCGRSGLRAAFWCYPQDGGDCKSKATISRTTCLVLPAHEPGEIPRESVPAAGGQMVLPLPGGEGWGEGGRFTDLQ